MKLYRLIPLIIIGALLLVSCCTVKETKEEVPQVVAPDLTEYMTRLQDARPEEPEFVDPMTNYWEIVGNSMKLAEGSEALREYAEVEKETIGEVVTIWPVDITEGVEMLLALEPTMVCEEPQLPFMVFYFQHYLDHAEIYCAWRDFADALEEYLKALAEEA